MPSACHSDRYGAKIKPRVTRGAMYLVASPDTVHPFELFVVFANHLVLLAGLFPGCHLLVITLAGTVAPRADLALAGSEVLGCTSHANVVVTHVGAPNRCFDPARSKLEEDIDWSCRRLEREPDGDTSRWSLRGTPEAWPGWPSCRVRHVPRSSSWMRTLTSRLQFN